MIVYLFLFILLGVEGKMFYLMVVMVIIVLLFVMVFIFMLVFVVVVLFLKGKISEKESLVIVGVKLVYSFVLKWVLKLCWLVVCGVVLFVIFSILFGSKLGFEFVF